MKIIGGMFKGRIINMPKGVEIRPTPDRVREALFNIIKARIEGASVLDLFAGSGALAIEALSRGAKSAVFVDRNKRCVDTITKSLAPFKLDANIIRIYHNDSIKAIKRLSDSNIRFDIVFLDPPYYGDWVKKCLISLDRYDILKNPSLIVCEHFKKDVVPEQIGAIKRTRQDQYGDTVLSFYIRDN